MLSTLGLYFFHIDFCSWVTNVVLHMAILTSVSFLNDWQALAASGFQTEVRGGKALVADLSVPKETYLSSSVSR